MAQNEIYKILIDYIQEDNRWKEKMNHTVSSIEAQTKLTNGRLNKIEPTVERLEKVSAQDTTTRQINWKWLSLIGAGILFILEKMIDFVVRKIN